MSDEQPIGMRYIGCIGIKTSMRSLSPKTRTELVKESINRLCKANKIERTSESKSTADVELMLHDAPNLEHSGTDVELCVYTDRLNLISKETGQLLIEHEMRNVSFASKGDDDTADFVAYVAKNETYGRACFVLDCGYETGINVLERIAIGFHERIQFKPFKNNSPSLRSPSFNHEHQRFNNPCFAQKSHIHSNGLGDDVSLLDEENRAEIRATLEREPWFHGSLLSREESESRLERDGDFLVRESLVDPGHYVLSVMHNGVKLHLLFDSMGRVKTKDQVFGDISELIRYHHNGNNPIVADSRVVFLRNGVRPTARPKQIIN